MPSSRAASGCGPSWCCIPPGCSGWTMRAALRVGAAIEVLHTYSLVHDDLPCMDDDDLRRGRPTTHIAFDEMTAVLAGDALLTIAFEILADAKTHPDPPMCACALVARLAEAAGHDGMIGGQIIDMLADAELRRGRCDQSAAAARPASCSNSPARRDRSWARRRRKTAPGCGPMPEEMGVVFQITDDLLDVTSTAEKTGKAVGKDADMGKATLVTLLGVEGARAEAEKRARRRHRGAGPLCRPVARIVRPAAFPAGPGSLKRRSGIAEPVFAEILPGCRSIFAASRVSRDRSEHFDEAFDDQSHRAGCFRWPFWFSPPPCPRARQAQAPIPPPPRCRVSMTRWSPA